MSRGVRQARGHRASVLHAEAGLLALARSFCTLILAAAEIDVRCCGDGASTSLRARRRRPVRIRESVNGVRKRAASGSCGVTIPSSEALRMSISIDDVILALVLAVTVVIMFRLRNKPWMTKWRSHT
jgi:hypothetical protein